MPPRRSSAVPSHAGALASALATVTLGPADDAAKRLALEYAQGLDSGTLELAKIGKDYLAVLAALGLTPAARKAAVSGKEAGGGEAAGDQLSKYRQRRAERGEG